MALSTITQGLSAFLPPPGAFSTLQCSSLVSALLYQEIPKNILESLLQNCKKFLNKKETPYQITALHIAALKQNLPLCQALCEHRASPNTPDVRGFTPLHWAAMGANPTFVDPFISACKPRRKTLNAFGGTYKDILNMLQTGNQTFSQEVQEQCHFTGEKLSEHRITSATLGKLWLDPPPIPTFRVSANLKEYEAFLNSPPKLLVKPMSHNDLGIPIPNLGCGLYAGQDIPKGTILSEYLGDIVDSNPQDQAYFFSLGESTSIWGIDSKFKRNEAPFSNDGFPNSEQTPVPNLHGLPLRVLLRATEDIKKGDPIVWDYGPHYSEKFAGLQELRKGALEHYFTENKIQDLVKKSKDLSIHSKLGYLLSSPHTLLELLKQEILTTQDLNDLLEFDALKEFHFHGLRVNLKMLAILLSPLSKETQFELLQALQKALPALFGSNTEYGDGQYVAWVLQFYKTLRNLFSFLKTNPPLQEIAPFVHHWMVETKPLNKEALQQLHSLLSEEIVSLGERIGISLPQA